MNPWLCNLLFNNSGGVSLPTTGQTFYASLKNSLVPEVGTGGPTWSRATAAWRFNDIGLLRQIPSWCAEFGGARLVVNTVRTKSEDFSTAAWTKTNLTVTGTTVLVCSNSTADNSLNQQTDVLAPTTVGQYFRYSARVRKIAGGVDYVQIGGSSTSFGSTAFCTFSLINGTYSAQSGVTANVTKISSDTYDFSVRIAVTVTTPSSDIFYICMSNSLSDTRKQAFVGDGVKSYELIRVWSCDVTGYDASYVPEYVSVGVLSAPYHGAGADGCKYFATDWQGAPIPTANLTRLRKESSATNSLLWSRDLAGQTWTEAGGNFTSSAWITSVTGSNLVTNGDFASGLSGWNDNGASTNTWSGGRANLDGTGGVGGIYQGLTTTVGKTYLITASMTVISGSGNAIVSIKGATVGSTTIKYDGSTVSKNISIIFKATLTNHVLYIYTSSGRISQFDDIVVKECTCAPERTIAGLDGIANSATTLTATATDAIILQPITLASAARCASTYVKRVAGTGTISFTQDGGSTWTDITPNINPDTFSRVQITATLANPSVGFKISTSGDVIAVDCVQNEAGSVATSPIVTTTATVARNADSLTYQTSGNIDATVGSCYARYMLYEEISASPRAIVALSTSAATANALLYHALSVSSSSLYSGDGTTSISKTGLLSSANTYRKRAISWGGVTRLMTGDGVSSSSGVFSGTLPSTSVGIGAYTNNTFSVNGYIGDIAIYNYKMTDAELQAITT